MIRLVAYGVMAAEFGILFPMLAGPVLLITWGLVGLRYAHRLWRESP